MNVHAVDIAHQSISMPTTPFVVGPIWFEVRPNLRRRYVVAGDILAALGKSRDVAGKGRNEHEDVTHAVAWLRGYHVTDLVVVEAQRLQHLVLRHLADLAAQAGVDLWLLHRPPRDDTFLRALARRGAVEQPLGAVPAYTSPAPLTPAPAVALPPVPHTEFVTFRATCRRTLTTDSLELVDSRFLATARHCLARLTRADADRGTIATLVYEMLNSAPDDPELVTDLRALQTAAWHHDLYVRIDLPRLLNSEERPRIPVEEADTRLTAYRQPYRAITAALTRQGAALEDIAALRLCDVDPSGEQIHCAGRAIPLGPHTTRAAEAQRHLRSQEGAGPTDHFLPHTTKALAKVLTDAAQDLGLHLHGRRAERTRDHTEGALRALGITVTRLT
jgi:hypothetical protein